jgi:hypothetical protein
MVNIYDPWIVIPVSLIMLLGIAFIVLLSVAFITLLGVAFRFFGGSDV